MKKLVFVQILCSLKPFDVRQVPQPILNCVLRLHEKVKLVYHPPHRRHQVRAIVPNYKKVMPLMPNPGEDVD